MTISRQIASLLGAAVLVGVLAVPAFGYTGEVPTNITVTGQVAGVRCSKAITLSATVNGASGTGVPGVTVNWSETSAPVGAHDTLGSASTTSGANGAATNTLTLSCVVGERTVTATAQGGVLGAIRINLGASGLPNTATLEDVPSGQPAPIALLVLAMLAMIGAAIGAAVSLRRLGAGSRG